MGGVGPRRVDSRKGECRRRFDKLDQPQETTIFRHHARPYTTVLATGWITSPRLLLLQSHFLLQTVQLLLELTTSHPSYLFLRCQPFGNSDSTSTRTATSPRRHRYPQRPPPSTLTFFANLPRLRLRSFRFSSLLNSSILPPKLLSHLPPTVTRLEFPVSISFRFPSQFKSFIRSDSRHQ